MGQVSEETSSSSFGAKAAWLDSPSLLDKYRTRPAQHAAIKRNAKKIWHPDRECNLYEDKDFESKEEEGSSSSKRRTEEITQRDANAYRPEKKPRLEAQAPADKEAEKEARKKEQEERKQALEERKRKAQEEKEAKLRKPFTEAQGKKLDKLLETLGNATTHVSGLLDRVSKEATLKESMPGSVPQMANVHRAALQEQIANINMAKVDGWIGNCKKVIDAAVEAIKKADAHNDKFEQWVADFDEAAA